MEFVLNETQDSTDFTRSSCGDTESDASMESGRITRQREEENQNNALFNSSTIERVREKYAAIRAASFRGEQIVIEIEREYALSLDTYVGLIDTTIDDMRDGKRNDWSDSELGAICIRLPVMLYRLGTGVDRAALEMDVAKAMIESVRAQRYIEAPGKTIPDKKAHAELAAMDEATVVDLARHVHARLKHRVEMGQLLFDGVRKIYSQRQIDKQVFGRTRE